MHPNPVFRDTPDEVAFELVRTRAFGQMTTQIEGHLVAAHVPILLADDAKSLEMHLMRSNPIARALNTPIEVLLSVTGPDGYVSPDWYGSDDQVPTWNYIAVHLRGTLERLDHSTMRDMLDRQSAHFETQLPKTPWTTKKMTPEILDRMMRQIVPCRMAIASVDCTFKLNQNKPDDARLKAADHMEQAEIGQETTALAELMRAPPMPTG